jgi:hypothetical protein
MLSALSFVALSEGIHCDVRSDEGRYIGPIG